MRYRKSAFGFLGGSTSNSATKNTQEPTIRHFLDTEHIAGAPAGETGQILDGAPGFVTQGDLLSMIGSALTPRGDTFLVRTYGDTVNPATGVATTAYCEAVVQRVVDPVTPSASDPYKPADAFGRKFKVVSFRWLTAGEL